MVKRLRTIIEDYINITLRESARCVGGAQCCARTLTASGGGNGKLCVTRMGDAASPPHAAHCTHLHAKTVHDPVGFSQGASPSHPRV